MEAIRSDVKLAPLSLNNSAGNPKMRKTFSSKAVAVAIADWDFIGMAIRNLDVAQMTVKMLVCPREDFGHIIKSMYMRWNTPTIGNVCNGAFSWYFAIFLCWQILHDLTNFSTDALMFGQKYPNWIRARVFSIPRCPEVAAS